MLLRQGSIRYQLIVIFMIISAIVLGIASLTFFAWNYVQFRAELRRELSIQALMVLEHSMAAISFRDEQTARETLQTLARNPHIRAGCLYNPTGELFADFRVPNEQADCPPQAGPAGFRFSPNRLEVVEHADVSGRPGGSVLLRSTLDALTSHLRALGVTVAAAFFTVLSIAFILSWALQRIIADPVAALAETARQVSVRGDVSLRAGRSTSNELNTLVDAVNEMLTEIQQAQNERIALLHSEREANRLKDEFVMTLSHELRTPLNAILGWTRLLKDGIIPPEGTLRALEKIERNASAQARLVEDLLDVSRLAAGKFRLDITGVDLIEIARNAIETIQPEADARQVAIETHFAAPALHSSGDADRLQQVIWNLLSNAVKFSAAGSRVIVAARRLNGWDEVIVSDAGIGIDPNFLPRVFDPFRQADSSTTRNYAGLGLGLSIVRRIVSMHGGEISATSAGLGLGATFTVRLPVAVVDRGVPVADAHRRVNAASRRADLKGTTVLVVDDDGDERELLVSLFEAAGASVRSASSTAEALQLAAQDAPDALISDIAMPGQDGYALMARLEELLGSRRPAVAIALTAQAGERDRARALAAGFHQHVAKPFDPSGLVELVKELLAADNPLSASH